MREASRTTRGILEPKIGMMEDHRIALPERRRLNGRTSVLQRPHFDWRYGLTAADHPKLGTNAQRLPALELMQQEAEGFSRRAFRRGRV